MTTQFDTIFRQYDIRGVYGEDLTADVAGAIGKAFGTYIRRRGETSALVGMDNRLSSPVLKQAVVSGLRSTGINVVDIGTVITPIFYYSTVCFSIRAGIMITASHNPAQYNGFKVQYDGRTLYGPELQEIKALAAQGDFVQGSGGYETRSPVQQYEQMLQEKIRLSKKLKVVVDAGNGTAGLFVPAAMEKWGCETIPLYCDSDPHFPNHFPDPTQVKNLQALIKTVRDQHADVGLGFDGDGDRLGVVDEKGNIIWGDRLMILFWREILPRHPGTTAIVEVKCSNQLIDEIKKLGGKPMFYKTGHSLIKAKMKELDAVFTGEMSGHMFFADEYYGYDDAVYAAGRLLRILSQTDRSLSDLLSDLPDTFATPEIRIHCKEAEKSFYIAKARKMLGRFAKKTVNIDGIRVQFKDGWGLVRASNTGPELIVRYEGKTKEAYDRIGKIMHRSLQPLHIA